MLAEDYEEAKVVFPLGMQPKIDGVRSLKLGSLLTGRSMEVHANWHVTSNFSHANYDGFDGEMACGEETDEDLCRKTSSALSTKDSFPQVTWHLFDYVTEETRDLPYAERYAALKAYLDHLHEENPELKIHLRLVPMVIVHNLEELRAQDARWTNMGYEGSICRSLSAKHKSGRSTVKEGGLLRIKHFEEEDAVVLSVVEGTKNNNERQLDALGKTKRSSHKANKVPNGMVFSLICRVVKTGEIITVGSGRMRHADRIRYFQQPELIVGKTIKYKRFLHGEKDKPRFPTFQSIRIESDKT